MAKKITTQFKLMAPGGQATPAPPLGPVLGANGVNPGQFITQFNDATRELVTRDPKRSVEIIEYPDQTHSIQLDAPERLTRDIVKWVEALPRD